jgi:shikimate dehydrogenase
VSGLRALGFQGFNVTMPHKEAVLPLLDELDEAARASGAVNTVVVGERGLRGLNTDGSGFVEACGESGASFEETKVVVVGAGGTAPASCGYSTVAGGARRSCGTGYRRRTGGRDADVIVNATYLGMKDDDPLPVPASCLGMNTAVCTWSTGPAKRPGSSGSPESGGSARSPADECCSTRGSRLRGSGPAKNPTCVR